jgi:hypothetical protein
MSDRPAFPDPRDLSRAQLEHVVDLAGLMADRYRAHAEKEPSAEAWYIASLWASVSGWLDLAQMEIAFGDSA